MHHAQKEADEGTVFSMDSSGVEKHRLFWLVG
jgi:hypothetical protein